MEIVLVPTVLKWIHLMATIAWIGGMFTNFFIYMPAMSKALDPPTIGKLMGIVMKRYKVMVYVSMALFLLTGMISATIHYTNETVEMSSSWNIILAMKISLFTLMVILAIYAFEFLAPKVAKIAANGPSPELKRIQRSQMLLAMIGFILGMIVVAISAAL